LEASLEIEWLALPSTSSETDLLRRLGEALANKPEPERTLIGGFSIGARIAAQLSRDNSVAGLLGLSFPFHRRGAPLDRHGLRTLQAVTVPTLIVQGTRDTHGNRQQVQGMEPLPAHVQMCWLEDGNHHWLPRAKSNQDLVTHLRCAAQAIQSFAQAVVSSPHD